MKGKLVMATLRSALLCMAALCAIPVAHALPRDKVQTAHFKRDHPCPTTGSAKGPCKGYNVDHKKSLMTGGADHPDNMQWVKTADHKKKTKQDFVKCKTGPICLHRGVKKS